MLKFLKSRFNPRAKSAYPAFVNLTALADPRYTNALMAGSLASTPSGNGVLNTSLKVILGCQKASNISVEANMRANLARAAEALSEKR